MRGTGHKIRAGAHRPPPFALTLRHRLGDAPLPDEVSLEEHVPFVVDQNGCGTCFACAPAVAIWTTLHAQGNPLPFHISILELTVLVHALERAQTGLEDDPLYDWGGDPADVVTVMQHYGVRAARYRPGTDELERRCDASIDTVGNSTGTIRGVEPNLADATRDVAALLVGAHEISNFDPITDMRRALAAGIALTIAWRAMTEDYYVSADAVLSGRFGDANHDSVIVGYRLVGDHYQFRLLNSWGTGWGDGGYVWVNEQFIRDAVCRYAMSVRRI